MRTQTIALILLPFVTAAMACGGAGLHSRGLATPSPEYLRRQTSGARSGNGLPYPEPGEVVPKDVPQEWLDALKKAVDAGKIPDIPVTTVDPTTGLIQYPSGYDYSKACSWTLSKCQDGDIWLAPPGKVGLTADDGPTPATPDFINYLQDNKQTLTHFLIGSAIMWNPEAMKALTSATAPPAHLACHTFTHTEQTTKTNEEIVADLGWNMQLILDLTGKVPLYYRSPQGDADARTRAVAREVFGLQHVMWGSDKDANDWCLRDGSGTAQLDTCTGGVGKSYDSVVATETGWAKGDKSKGYIALEHETTDQSVNAFKEYHAALVANSWNISGVPQLQDLPWYQNQYSPDVPAIKATSVLPTHPPFTVTDSSAAPGTKGAPDVSAFNDLKTGASSASSGTNSTTPTTSSTNTTAQAPKAASNSSNNSAHAAPIPKSNGTMAMHSACAPAFSSKVRAAAWTTSFALAVTMLLFA